MLLPRFLFFNFATEPRWCSNHKTVKHQYLDQGQTSSGEEPGAIPLLLISSPAAPGNIRDHGPEPRSAPLGVGLTSQEPQKAAWANHRHAEQGRERGLAREGDVSGDPRRQDGARDGFHCGEGRMARRRAASRQRYEEFKMIASIRERIAAAAAAEERRGVGLDNEGKMVISYDKCQLWSNSMHRRRSNPFD